MELNGLEPEEAAVFEWQYGYCGSFIYALWEAIEKSDDINREKLGLGFPIEVNGFMLYAHVDGWWQAVQEKAIKFGYLKSRD